LVLDPEGRPCETVPMSFRSLRLVVLAFALSAGLQAKPPYVLAGVSYASAEQVFTVYRAAWAQQLKAVQRRQYYGGSLLLVLPPDSALMSAEFIAAYRPDFEADAKRVYQLWYQESANTTLAALNQAGLFDSVTMTRVVGYRRYAADFGYRYALVYVGRPDVLHLLDTVTREEVIAKPAGEGLAGVMNGVEQALDRLGHAPAVPVATAGKAGSEAVAAPPRVAEEMHYDEETRRGWVSVRGRGLEARDSVLRRIAEICATKNKLLISDDLAAARGAFKVLDEELKDGVLKITFEALY
jgi:hypothetical protein